MQNTFSILGGLLMAFTGALAAADAPVAKGVRVDTYTGWEESMFLSGGDCKAVIVPATGGRIAQYSLNGENILFENPASFGKTMVNTPEGFWVAGYQCDLGPEIRGLPDHPKLWMWPHRWRTPRENTVGLLSEHDLTVGIQMEKEIVMDPDTGELGLVQRMRNVIDRETAFCLWDRTLCKGGGFAFFPLNRSSRFPSGWSIRRTVDKKYSYNGKDPSDARVKVLDGVLVAQAGGPALKVGADSDAGWIAYMRARGGPSYHPGGTCRMGTGETAVVDGALRVHGAGREPALHVLRGRLRDGVVVAVDLRGCGGGAYDAVRVVAVGEGEENNAR